MLSIPLTGTGREFVKNSWTAEQLRENWLPDTFLRMSLRVPEGDEAVSRTVGESSKIREIASVASLPRNDIHKLSGS